MRTVCGSSLRAVRRSLLHRCLINPGLARQHAGSYLKARHLATRLQVDTQSASDGGVSCLHPCTAGLNLSVIMCARGGPIVVDAADLPESLRAQLQALESARSRKRDGAGGGDGDEDDDDDDDEDDEPALVSTFGTDPWAMLLASCIDFAAMDLLGSSVFSLIVRVTLADTPFVPVCHHHHP